MTIASENVVELAINDYLNSKKSLTNVASHYGYTGGWLLKHLNKRNIPRRNNSQWKINKQNQIDAISEYKNGVLVKDIAKKFGVCRRTISDWLIINGIKPLKLNQRLGITPQIKNEAIKLYKDDDLNCVEISKILNVSPRSVYEWIRPFSKSRSEINAILSSKGKKKTLGIRGKVNTRFGIIRYDSSYERDRILQLNNNQEVKSIERCKDRIKYGEKHYNPDFTITYNCGCVFVEEIKPSSLVKWCVNIEKFNSAIQFYKESKIIFAIITEKDIYGNK